MQLIPRRWRSGRFYIAVVVVVLVVLGLVSWWGWHRLELARQSSHASHCHGNLQRIFLALIPAFEERKEKYSHATSTGELLNMLVADGALSAKEASYLECGKSDYILAPSFKDGLKEPGSSVLLLYCPEDNNHPLAGRNALYSDGYIPHGIFGEPKNTWIEQHAKDARPVQ